MGYQSFFPIRSGLAVTRTPGRFGNDRDGGFASGAIVDADGNMATDAQLGERVEKVNPLTTLVATKGYGLPFEEFNDLSAKCGRLSRSINSLKAIEIQARSPATIL